MDIKAKAMELVTKIASDPKLLESFTKNPVPTVEKLIGIDLPDDQINMVVDMVKTKINLDKAGSLLSGLFRK